MQNEKQTKEIKVYEKKIQKKKWWTDKRHTLEEYFCSCMKIINEDEHFEKKKSVKQKAKGPTKRFSYDPMSPKRLGQEIKKFLSNLLFRGGVKLEEKEKWWLFFRSEEEKKWFQLVFKFCLTRKTRFAFEIHLDKFFMSQKKKPTNENYAVW